MAEDINEQLVNYLEDVHSLEQNAIAQLQTGVSQAGDERLKADLRELGLAA